MSCRTFGWGDDQASIHAFPEALSVLHRWQAITPDTRAIICHWHLQLTDPLYRAFSGDFLVARREAAVPEIYSNTVITWVADNGCSNWSLATRKQLATRLLSVALCAGPISGQRDPRSLIFPRIEDRALEYCLYLLRNVTFSGSLLETLICVRSDWRGLCLKPGHEEHEEEMELICLLR